MTEVGLGEIVFKKAQIKIRPKKRRGSKKKCLHLQLQVHLYLSNPPLALRHSGPTPARPPAGNPEPARRPTTDNMSESAAGSDLKGFKANLLQKVIPKTIVKEQHAGAVRALQFNHLPGGGPTPGRAGGAAAGSTACGNLFATVGGSFATVYDDEHFGDHVAVVVQFHNDATPYTSGGELTALCWVDGLGFSLHEFGDALLAVGGGDDHAVQVISVTEGRVVKLLKGHGGGILALASGSSAPTAAAAAPPRPELLVSLSLDGVGTPIRTSPVALPPPRLARRAARTRSVVDPPSLQSLNVNPKTLNYEPKTLNP